MNARSGFQTNEISRSLWLRYWSSVEPSEVQACVERVTQRNSVVDIRLPRSGLALMQMRDSALGDCFYMGEIPWSRAHVRVEGPDGLAGEGAADWMDDRKEMARHLAILDAVLAFRLDGWEHAQALLLCGQTLCRQQDVKRFALLESTRVDFRRLDENDE